MKSKVIVVSGVTASGKTTLVKCLHQNYSDSKIISFDNYDIDQLPTTPSIDVPLKEAVNQYDITALMKDLRKIYGTVPLILVDFPFGYQHQILRPLIDRVVYLKTPLDVAFARQIIRDDADKSVEEIISWAKTYLRIARPYFVANQEYIAENADLVLDGTLPLAEMVEKVQAII
ncbi:adenylylsulfate kinase [Lactobacillus sp. ESL0791]|uniref:adenylylsulfate kinase n=1 Tax=Lactobacillus sp. ESL0791 TaxID=2983234 RepID=UPI0023F9FD1E|nr:adenylylsulfate kinase [Lactobacillus sp. ESL0791]MDF7639890.1 adenylylsulfate kinase [Lactobacillus sp. ESL0791]